MQQLSIAEIDMVNGGVSEDTAYGASIGVSGGALFTAFACAAALTPVGMGLLLGTSILASSVAIYHAL